MKKSKKIYRKLLIGLIILYSAFTLIKQQKAINQYSDNCKKLDKQIEEAKNYNKELVAQKDNVDSKEYIQETAREKLDMYLPNEKVYIDKSN